MKDRAQVGIGGADVFSVGDGQVDPGDPLLIGTAQVVGPWMPGVGQRLEEGPRGWVRVRGLAQPDRPGRAPQFGVMSVNFFRSEEKFAQVFSAPPRGTFGGPAIVERLVGADMCHGVDRAAAAEGLADRVVHGAGVGLAGGDEPPLRW